MTSQTASPALVVGGTGMLSGLVHELTARGHSTTVVARDATRLQQVAAAAPGPGAVTPVQAHYALRESLRTGLDSAVQQWGPYGVAVLWVRTAHRESVQEEVSPRLADRALVVDVLGSGTRDPRELQPRRPEPFDRPEVTYRRAVLGFTDGPAGTRWLTDGEICQGVLDTLDSPEEMRVVGRVNPWHEHP
ncbi:short-chain dehydrogenase [Streptomyces sodiiphilus]|uniref:Short-chain dehydrogenase n=1 Tax=Streptomyces sodiiphilus TaxID=226217 RepID=A0ABN2NSS5_9ACTN